MKRKDIRDDDEPIPCIGRDPCCPCQDGDVCHYVDWKGTKAMIVQKHKTIERGVQG